MCQFTFGGSLLTYIRPLRTGSIPHLYLRLPARGSAPVKLCLRVYLDQHITSDTACPSCGPPDDTVYITPQRTCITLANWSYFRPTLYVVLGDPYYMYIIYSVHVRSASSPPLVLCPCDVTYISRILTRLRGSRYQDLVLGRPTVT